MVDDNDNSPVVSLSHAEVTVNELVSSGVPIVNVSATDNDIGINSQLNFSVVAVSARRFVKGTYQVTVTVGATDFGVPPLTGTETVVVKKVCEGSVFFIDFSDLQLKMVANGYYLDEGMSYSLIVIYGRL